ncbi:MAG: ATP-binding protein [Bacteroidales bacterium]|nr:ATP-binding protein [Bacteroidales bacterium]MDT8373654.1 ATP-binding protein [Bacteroidales bacterium]
MISRENLKRVIVPQNMRFTLHEETVPRAILKDIADLSGTAHVLIITGLRRAGKSTLLKQINENLFSSRSTYLNFEDEKLLSFTTEDFSAVQETFLELNGRVDVVFFDEIQNVDKWEIAVRRFHNEGLKVFITGSNASLLSKEFGTKLTGRHLNIVLYPFSFREYLVFREIELSENDFYLPEKIVLLRKDFNSYFEKGGIPEYLKYEREEIIKQIYEDILIKDIIVRYGIGDERSFRELASFLISNIGKLFSYTRLKANLGFGSMNTVKSYIAFMENSYLLFQVEKYDTSLKRQIINNKKVYCIDNSFLNLVSFETTRNLGRKLENIVFVELKRRKYTIHYHREKFECDFVLSLKNRVAGVIQVCYQLDNDNMAREINGIVEAAALYQLKEGLILTMEQEEESSANGISIYVLPVWKWLLM